MDTWKGWGRGGVRTDRGVLTEGFKIVRVYGMGWIGFMGFKVGSSVEGLVFQASAPACTGRSLSSYVPIALKSP